MAQLSPKQCVCGKQGKIKDSRWRPGHIWRRYVCECGEVWSTQEMRDVDLSRDATKIKDSIADKLIEMAQGLMARR